MSIPAILLAALLAGFGHFTMHPNAVLGGGPVTAPQSAPVAGGVTVNEVLGGGPVG
jgi:hypothetical protein